MNTRLCLYTKHLPPTVLHINIVWSIRNLNASQRSNKRKCIFSGESRAARIDGVRKKIQAFSNINNWARCIPRDRCLSTALTSSLSADSGYLLSISYGFRHENGWVSHLLAQLGERGGLVVWTDPKSTGLTKLRNSHVIEELRGGLDYSPFIWTYLQRGTSARSGSFLEILEIFENRFLNCEFADQNNLIWMYLKNTMANFERDANFFLNFGLALMTQNASSLKKIPDLHIYTISNPPTRSHLFRVFWSNTLNGRRMQMLPYSLDECFPEMSRLSLYVLHLLPFR